jgi:hypothetical protein
LRRLDQPIDLFRCEVLARPPRQHDEIMEEIVEQERLEILQQVRERSDMNQIVDKVDK